MAEGTGLEPASPCGRRFSRPLHYQLCYPSESLAVDDSLHVRVRSTVEFLWGQLKVRVRHSLQNRERYRPVCCVVLTSSVIKGPVATARGSVTMPARSFCLSDIELSEFTAREFSVERSLLNQDE